MVLKIERRQSRKHVNRRCCSHLGVDFEMKAKMFFIKLVGALPRFYMRESHVESRAGARASTRLLQLS